MRPQASSTRGKLASRSAGRVRARRVVPHASGPAAEASTLEWAGRFGLAASDRARGRLEAIGCGSCAAHTYPRADEEVIELGAHLIAWLFLFDDEHVADVDALAPLFDGFELLLFGGKLPEGAGPFHHALDDLLRRLTVRAASDEWMRRFAYSLRRYFDGCLLEFPYHRTGRSPSLSVYRSLRRWSIGVLPLLDLVELTLPARLSGPMTAMPGLWDLRDRAALLCAWASDLYSYSKEREADDPLNLVSVLRHERRLTIDRAFTHAVDVYNLDLERFDDLRAAFVVAPGIGELERAYLDGVRAWIDGNHVWTRTTARHRR